MRYVRWQSGILAGLVFLNLYYLPTANGQAPQTPAEYLPGTLPWVPLIDECISAGGQRNDCIETLPPQMYADFVAAEKSRYAERLTRGEIPPTPWVPPPELLPDIYISPASMPELRAEVAESLVVSGCLIPNSMNGRSNVVVGQLAAAGQQDIAVICSVGGTSRIRIFWGGSASCPPLDYSSPDWALLDLVTEWEYLWAIALASPAHILRYYERYPEECRLENLPSMIHDGLEDIIAEKGSSNFYCYDGRWLHLCGAD